MTVVTRWRGAEPVADLVPQAGPAQAGLDQVVALLAARPDAGQLEPADQVVVQRHGGERVGAPEDHADPAAHLGGAAAGRVHVLALQQDLAGQGGAGPEPECRGDDGASADAPPALTCRRTGRAYAAAAHLTTGQLTAATEEVARMKTDLPRGFRQPVAEGHVAECPDFA